MTQLRHFLRRITTHVSRFTLRLQAPAPHPTAPHAHVTVGTEVIAPHPERFGVNVMIDGYHPAQPKTRLLNTWLADGGMEPVILRYKGTATGGSADSIENAGAPLVPYDERGDFENADGLTTSVGGKIGDGFFDGADVRVYRVEGGQARLLRTARVVRYLASEASGHRIILDAPGPPIQAGDLYFLSLTVADAPMATVAPERRPAHAAADPWRVYPPSAEGRVHLRRDLDRPAPADDSRASLRITLDEAGEGGIQQWVSLAPPGSDRNTLAPGAAYAVSAWLRQEGIASGQARLSLHVWGSRVEQRVAVTDEWAQYTWRFKAPRAVQRRSAALCITFAGPGHLWVDNVRLVDADRPPGALRPEAIQGLKDYRPGALRIWSSQTNLTWGTTLDNWLAPEGLGLRQWSPNTGVMPSPLFNLPTALAVARDVGATPWLIVGGSLDETEWAGLLEYLAGPPDSPYGARRAAQGQTRPWTDEFDRLHIEYGNEMWNGLFGPWVYPSGAEYGAFAERFFGVLRASPYYPAVADRLDFVLNGRRRVFGLASFGARARRAVSFTPTIGVQSYTIGLGFERVHARTQEERFQVALLSGPWLRHYFEQHLATQRLLTKMGYPHRLAVFEGGPDFGLPAPDRPTTDEQEHLRKSLATAVSTLDTFLYNSSQGLGPQAFSFFGVGPRWASHARWGKDFRPHLPWLALQLRNRLASGPMVATTVMGAATIDLPAVHTAAWEVPARPNVDLVAAYAFRDGGRHAVFVLSRDLTRVTPVTLHLPTRPATVTLYSLAGDPRATNIERLTIDLEGRRLPQAGQAIDFDLPPAAIYLFVTQADGQ